jgi:hypothetical protein
MTEVLYKEKTNYFKYLKFFEVIFCSINIIWHTYCIKLIENEENGTGVPSFGS